MNKPLLIFLFVFMCGAVRLSAQVNLVPNPSFELYDTCPNTVVIKYFDNYVESWKNYGYTPEYFNSCATGTTGVPYNVGGYQIAATGTAYAGIYTYESLGPNVREFIGTQMNSSLIPGVKYFVYFKANLAIDSQHVFNYATNFLGARFSTVPFSENAPPLVNNFAHVFNSSVISDTSSWTIVGGSFIADSAYQYIAIGCFFTDSVISVIHVQDTIYDISSYYYIDDVYVSTDSMDMTGSIEQNNELNIFPNPVSDDFTIEIPSKHKLDAISITMYNLLGEIVEEKVVSIPDGKYTESRNGLRSGVYLLKIEAGEEVYYRQIIFQ